MQKNSSHEELANIQYKKMKKEQSFFRKLVKNKFAAVGLLIIIILILVSSLAPIIAPYPPNSMSVGNSFLPFGTKGNILGTDSYGRDILSRLIYGSRISLLVGISAVVFGALLGSLLGVISGYFGGK